MALRSAEDSANEQYKRANTDDSDTSGLKIGRDHYCHGLPSSLLNTGVFGSLDTYFTGPNNTDIEDGDLARVRTAMSWVLCGDSQHHVTGSSRRNVYAFIASPVPHALPISSSLISSS